MLCSPHAWPLAAAGPARLMVAPGGVPGCCWPGGLPGWSSPLNQPDPLCRHRLHALDPPCCWGGGRAGPGGCQPRQRCHLPPQVRQWLVSWAAETTYLPAEAGPHLQRVGSPVRLATALPWRAGRRTGGALSCEEPPAAPACALPCRLQSRCLPPRRRLQTAAAHWPRTPAEQVLSPAPCKQLARLAAVRCWYVVLSAVQRSWHISAVSSCAVSAAVPATGPGALCRHAHRP